MKTSASTSSAPSIPASSRDDSIRHLPAAARAAFERFQADGDLSNLDPVVLAILNDYIPQRSTVPLADLPGSTKLIDDLGFDSVAITEVVFFVEDLFGFSISNEEIVSVRTLDDLRGFIRRKVALHPVR